MKKALTVCLAMMMMAVLPGGTLASSVWLANGVTTDTGGTLVGFNRDSRPDGQQLMWIKPDSGFSYFALFAPDLFDNRQPVIGVNQAGLLVASLPVITIPVVYRQDMTYNHNLIRQILRQCGTVDD
ncbi:MAG: hypothetical protein N3A57_03425, partial [Negativicutes bacterium]|nr:hypothetical protein [Negativicutes bacterium]